jgi:ribonuclease-3
MSAPTLQQFAATLGLKFKDAELLTQAFTHRSYLNEHPELARGHNERLEFLGDAVLELAVTEYLYRRYPEKAEGELTVKRAALVNTEVLGAVGEALGLNEHLRLSRGESKDTGRARQVILANTLESFLGAVFLDRGYEAVKSFLERELFPRAEVILAENTWPDAKSLFQERAQAERGVTPSYQVLSQLGPDHDKLFKVGVYLGEAEIAQGEGSSKQRAEVEAAKAALERLGWRPVAN